MKERMKRLMAGQGSAIRNYIENELNDRVGGLSKANKKEMKEFETLFASLKSKVSGDDALLAAIKQSVMDNESSDAARDIELKSLKSLNDSLKDSLQKLQDGFDSVDADELIAIFDKHLHGRIDEHSGAL